MFSADVQLGIILNGSCIHILVPITLTTVGGDLRVDLAISR